MPKIRANAAAEGMEIRGPKGYWHFVDFDRKNNRNRWRSTGTADLDKAKEVRQQRQARTIRLAKPGGAMTIAEARPWYIQGHPVNAPETIDNLFRLATPVHDCQIGDPNTELAIENLRDDLLKTHASRSVCNVLGHLKAIMRYVSRTRRDRNRPEKIYTGPLPVIAFPSRDQDPVRRYKATTFRPTEEQVARLRAYTRHQSVKAGHVTLDEKLVVMFYEGGGQRAERVARLPRANIDLVNGVIDFANIPGIRHSPNKRGNPEVPITAELRRFLTLCANEAPADKYYVGSNPMTREGVSKRINSLFRKVLGINHGGSHSLRKAVATHLEAKGEKENIGLMLGIDQATAVTSYCQPDVKRRREIAEKISQGTPAAGDVGNVIPLKKG
jgi:integrase